ncbi:hypothetical protein LINGRAHAP2_LOCUS27895 [Linum grandiflorum]
MVKAWNLISGTDYNLSGPIGQVYAFEVCMGLSSIEVKVGLFGVGRMGLSSLQKNNEIHYRATLAQLFP